MTPIKTRFSDQIWFRQTRNTIAVGLALGLLMVSVTIFLDLRNERVAIRAEVDKAVETLSRPAIQAVFNIDRALAQTVAEGLMSFHAIRGVRIIDDLGEALADEEARAAEAPAWKSWLADWLFGDFDVRRFPLEHPTSQGELGRIEVSLDRVLATEQFFQRAGVVLAGGLLRNLVLCLCLLGLFYHTLTRPLVQLASRIDEIDPNAPKANLPVPQRHQTSELGRMTIVLNRLLTRLSESQKALEDHRADLERAVAERTAELEQANARLAEIAGTDELTKLANRRTFMTAAEHELSRAARSGSQTAVMMIDLDHFKRINDRFGHAVGDAALVAFAGTLVEGLRGGDLAARYGGEEFVVLLPETGTEDAMVLAERLRVAVAALALKEQTGVDVALTASFGLATSGPGVKGLDGLLQEADEALYRAKAAGRNAVKS